MLQLYLRHGPLWEAVRDVRARKNITAQERLPPAVRGLLLPEGAPDIGDRAYGRYAVEWGKEMSAVREKGGPGPSPGHAGVLRS